MSFLEKSTKDGQLSSQKSGYTREYSYDIDSETLRHSGQSDPRGLGFTYEKMTAPTSTLNKPTSLKQKGTALAFTYNPRSSSKTELVTDNIRTQQKEVHSSKLTEPRYVERKSTQPQKGFSQASDERGYHMRSKSPETRGEAVQSNIDESSELSSVSQESMVDEYAKESMRQKTSALIAGSAPTRTSQNELSSRYGLPANESAKQQRQPLWGQEHRPASTRLPILAPSDSSGIERKYTHLSRKRVVQNADGSVEENEEIIDPDSIDLRRRTTPTKPLSSMVKINTSF